MVNEKRFEKLERSRIRLTVSVKADEVRGAYEKLRSDYAKKIHIDGFRPGKVPPAILERKLGDALKAETMGYVIEQAMEEALEGAEHKPVMYSMPELEGRPDFDLDSDFSFTVSYDTFPEVSVSSLDGMTIEVPVVEIGKEDEKRELEGLRERNALVVDKPSGSKAAKGDIATISYREMDETGADVPDSLREDFVFEIGSGYNLYDIDDDIVGMTVGESRKIEKAYPADYRYSELAGKRKIVRVDLTALKEKKLPELDDEFAQDVSERFSTLDDLKADIRAHLEKSLEAKLKAIREKAVVEALLERSTVDLPLSMVDAELRLRWDDLKRRMNVQDDAHVESLLARSGKSRDALVEEWRPAAERAIRTRIVIDKLVADRAYAVEEADLEREYARVAAENSMDAQAVKEEYAKRGLGERLADQIREDKLFADLVASATIKKGRKTSFVDLFGEND